METFATLTKSEVISFLQHDIKVSEETLNMAGFVKFDSGDEFYKLPCLSRVLGESYDAFQNYFGC